MHGTRPGGLTAMAVLNFVFGGGKALFSLLGMLTMAFVQSVAGDEMEELTEGQIVQEDITILLIVYVVQFASAGLAIASGIGYLQMKRFLGRTLGNSYAILSLAALVVGLGVSSERFSMFTLVFAIYPVLTLILLNTTFKEDFVN